MVPLKKQPEIGIDYNWILLIINTIGSQFFYRFDLTKIIDIRFLALLDIVKQVKEPLYIKIYRRFARNSKDYSQETAALEEFQTYNQI
jgi:hypothetical protein